MAVVWKKILLTGDAAELSDNAPNTIQPDDATSAGSGTEASRDDHEHGIVAAAPSTVGSANSEGNSTSFARANHIHQREHAKYTDANARTAAVEDAAYGAGWNGDTTHAPSQNAVWDKIESLGGGAATKEFFVLAQSGTVRRAVSSGTYHAIRLNAIFETAYTSFTIPNDFSSIISAEWRMIVKSTQANADWNIGSNYAAVGEAYQTHNESDNATTYNVVNNQIFAVDISGILSAITAGDMVGVQLQQGTAGHNVDVLGVRFRYS